MRLRHKLQLIFVALLTCFSVYVYIPTPNFWPVTTGSDRCKWPVTTGCDRSPPVATGHTTGRHRSATGSDIFHVQLPNQMHHTTGDRFSPVCRHTPVAPPVGTGTFFTFNCHRSHRSPVVWCIWFRSWTWKMSLPVADRCRLVVRPVLRPVAPVAPVRTGHQ